MTESDEAPSYAELRAALWAFQQRQREFRRKSSFEDFIESIFISCRDRDQELPSEWLPRSAQQHEGRLLELLGPLFPDPIETERPAIQIWADYNARQPGQGLTICDCGWQGVGADDCPTCGDPFWIYRPSARIMSGARRSWSARNRMDRWTI